MRLDCHPVYRGFPLPAGSALAVVSACGVLLGSGEGSGLDSASGSGVAPPVPVSVGKLAQSAVMSRRNNDDNDDNNVDGNGGNDVAW